MRSTWKCLVRHARYFTSCIFYSLILCLYYFYVYIYKQIESPEDFITSLRAETKTGYIFLFKPGGSHQGTPSYPSPSHKYYLIKPRDGKMCILLQCMERANRVRLR
ncbi:hypothetical protein BJV78DRAFT_1251862 [Lactifluus subvellereus]|nr:hypothetical protein BJV78DRAFT_1251862 [Lactifluus subvellereus]